MNFNELLKFIPFVARYFYKLHAAYNSKIIRNVSLKFISLEGKKSFSHFYYFFFFFSSLFF